MIMFKINNKDYSNHVVAEGYNVARNSLYKTWNDANGIEHHSEIRKRVSGSFTMLFVTKEEYQTFLADVAASKRDDDTHTIIVAINKPNNQNVVINAFLEFDVERSVDGAWNDIFNAFTMKILER